MWQTYPFINDTDTQHKPLIAISACLCGDAVRYDGGSKWQPALINALEAQLTLIKLCPEVAIGMGTPRAPIQLNKAGPSISAVGVCDPTYTVTQPLRNFADLIINQQQRTMPRRIHAYLFKSRSPSCGVGSTPIYQQGAQIALGHGIVAYRIKQKLPWLTVVEEDDLDSPIAIERFIFLAHLSFDILNSQASVQALHTHHATLHRALPAHWQTQLEHTSTHADAVHDYLATLKNALLSLTTAQFARIFESA